MKLPASNCVQVANIDDELWVVTLPYVYVTKSGVRLEVPEGFETDGASVPRCLWGMIPATGRHFNAAVVHDFLYRSEGDAKLPKSQCDDIFLEIMLRDQVPELRARAMHEAVALFGYSSYHRGKAAALASLQAQDEEESQA